MNNQVWLLPSRQNQLAFDLRVDLCDGDRGARLPVHQSPQPRLSLDDAVGDTHFAAQRREEDYQLVRVKNQHLPTETKRYFQIRRTSVWPGFVFFAQG